MMRKKIAKTFSAFLCSEREKIIDDLLFDEHQDWSEFNTPKKSGRYNLLFTLPDGTEFEVTWSFSEVSGHWHTGHSVASHRLMRYAKFIRNVKGGQE